MVAPRRAHEGYRSRNTGITSSANSRTLAVAISTSTPGQIGKKKFRSYGAAASSRRSASTISSGVPTR